MEDQLASLIARVGELEDSAARAHLISSEFYYYMAIPIMVLIHAGFFSYEMGATRVKNVLSSCIKNMLAFAFVIPCFFTFGWFIYWAFPNGLIPSAENIQTALAYANPVSSVMGPNLADNTTGVIWGACALFAATTASILSGAVIERIRVTAFVILAIALGAFAWVLAAAWGWRDNGWLVTDWGFHDFGAAGAVHVVAGFFALGVLINLGPRLGKYNPDGSINRITGHNMPLTLIGLMLIIVGFFGFFMSCLLYPQVHSPENWSSIYGTPTTLSGVTFNILMGCAGGIVGTWAITRNPFWMMSGGLAGMVACAPGMDIWWPPMAFLIGAIGGAILQPVSHLFEKFGIDDAVSAVSLHGVIGLWGLMAMGLFASGYPALIADNAITTSLLGQLVGAGVMVLCGFVPGYFLSLIMRLLGVLRVSEITELTGLDAAGGIPLFAYPEGMSSAESRSESDQPEFHDDDDVDDDDNDKVPFYSGYY